MKHLLIASALAMLVFPGVVAADDNDGWKDRQEAHREAWKDRREAEREYAKDRREAEREYWKDRREAEREYAKDRREFEKDRRKAYEEREKEYRHWARGDYIPHDYLVDRYYVRDYGVFGLAPPPRGHLWVRPYRDAETFYLVQVATGLVSEILDD